MSAFEATMLKRFLIIISISSCFLFYLDAFATSSVFICGGIYQNKPCAKGVPSTEKKLRPINKYKTKEFQIRENIIERDLPINRVEERESLRLNDSLQKRGGVENIPEDPKAVKTPSSEATPELAEEVGKNKNLRISGPKVDAILNRALSRK